MKSTSDSKEFSGGKMAEAAHFTLALTLSLNGEGMLFFGGLWGACLV